MHCSTARRRVSVWPLTLSQRLCRSSCPPRSQKISLAGPSSTRATGGGGGEEGEGEGEGEGGGERRGERGWEGEHN